jgi:hypothetical protein
MVMEALKPGKTSAAMTGASPSWPRVLAFGRMGFHSREYSFLLFAPSTRLVSETRLYVVQGTTQKTCFPKNYASVNSSYSGLRLSRLWFLFS